MGDWEMAAVVCCSSGCGAAWLARLSGGQEVVGSNPASPTNRFKKLI